MGRAIAGKPAVFFIDEPLANLEAILRVQMQLEIRKLQCKFGITSIVVTHGQVEAMTLGNRSIVLNNGNVEQFGTPIELYERPTSLFVAQFIGSPSMYILSGHSEGYNLKLSNYTEFVTNATADGHVNESIRPEHFSLDDTGHLIVATDMIELLGSNTLVHGTLIGTDTPIVYSLPRIHTESSLGQNVHLGVNNDAIHLFEPTNGHRIES